MFMSMEENTIFVKWEDSHSPTSLTLLHVIQQLVEFLTRATPSKICCAFWIILGQPCDIVLHDATRIRSHKWADDPTGLQEIKIPRIYMKYKNRMHQYHTSDHQDHQDQPTRIHPFTFSAPPRPLQEAPDQCVRSSATGLGIEGSSRWINDKKQEMNMFSDSSLLQLLRHCDFKDRGTWRNCKSPQYVFRIFQVPFCGSLDPLDNHWTQHWSNSANLDLLARP